MMTDENKDKKLKLEETDVIQEAEEDKVYCNSFRELREYN